MSPELVEKRQNWYNSLKPGDLVYYNRGSEGIINKPALILEAIYICKDTPRQKEYKILYNEKVDIVHQYLLCPLDGWQKIDLGYNQSDKVK